MKTQINSLKKRQSIKLKEYDYSSPGVYFITICTHEKRCLFGEIKDGIMIKNKFGRIAEDCWLEIPKHFPNVELDEFVIMPNHIHGILIITDGDDVGAQHFAPAIGSVVKGYKIGVTKRCRDHNHMHKIWQRNYYEHIVRSEKSLERIQDYIINNPLTWEKDEMFAGG